MNLRSNQSNRVGAVVSLAALAFAVVPVSHAGTPSPAQLLAPQVSGAKFNFSFITSFGQGCTVRAITNLATSN